MEFDEDDLPGWGMAAATFEGMMQGSQNLSPKDGYKARWGFHVIHPEQDKEALKKYYKTPQGKMAQRRAEKRYRESFKGKLTKARWRQSPKGQAYLANAKVQRAEWLKTEKGQAYLARRKAQALAKRAANLRQAVSAAQNENPRLRSLLEAEKLPSGE